jgi:GH43 family beta-xylosidase
MKGKVAAATDKWAIDASTFDHNGKSYIVWSGWPADANGEQDIYIALLSNPWTIAGDRVLLSTPTMDWEKRGAPPAINEGPEALHGPGGQLFLTYSASGCWTDDYCLGLLTLKAGGDPLNPGDWTKQQNPVFVKNAANGAYGPGHNGFFKSKDGTQDWIIYHANTVSGQGCGNSRNPRMQSFTWNSDGSPNFGTPAPVGVRLKKPAGE